MRALIIYDSVFGNTSKIAQSIFQGFSPFDKVRLCHISDIAPTDIEGIGIVIMGSPTRGFRPTKAIMDFINQLSESEAEKLRLTSFDTRLSLPEIKSSATRFIIKTGGFAARRISDRFQKKGAQLLVSPQGFLVSGEKGPLLEGEIQQAKDWGTMISRQIKILNETN